MGNAARECATDADDPANITNVGNKVQCGFRSVAMFVPVEATKR